MNTVFILTGSWDYEGSEVLGVFADKQSAKIASAKWIGEYDRLEIDEWKVESYNPPTGYFGRRSFAGSAAASYDFKAA